jgi:hypothetical protein
LVVQYHLQERPSSQESLQKVLQVTYQEAFQVVVQYPLQERPSSQEAFQGVLQVGVLLLVLLLLIFD